MLCRNVHPNDEYHRRTAVIFGNFLRPVLSPTRVQPHNVQLWCYRGTKGTHGLVFLVGSSMIHAVRRILLFAFLPCVFRSAGIGAGVGALKSTPCLFSLFFKPLVLENKTRKAKSKQQCYSKLHILQHQLFFSYSFDALLCTYRFKVGRCEVGLRKFPKTTAVRRW